MKNSIDGSYKKLYMRFFEEALKESEKGYYDECALPSYTHRNRLVSWLFWERIVAALSIAGDLRNKAILDFGCGSGVLFKYLSDQHCKITGCDNRYYWVAQRFAEISSIGVDMYRDLLDIKDKKFDVIFALDVLEHVDNVLTVIEKFHELSHNETMIILSGPTENILYKLGRKIVGFSNHYHKRNIYDIEKELQKRGYMKKALRRLFPIVTLFRVGVWSRSA